MTAASDFRALEAANRRETAVLVVAMIAILSRWASVWMCGRARFELLTEA